MFNSTRAVVAVYASNNMTIQRKYVYMAVMRTVNLGVRFLLELSILFAVGAWGWTLGAHAGTRIIWALGLSLLVALVWGIFLAPASLRRLRATWRFPVELGIITIAVVALYTTQRSISAAIFAFVYMINKLLMYIWGQS
ncbi:MAG: YrdB family protein [Caldilineaceae bacterium]